jgi:hypothetical protein
MAWKGTIRRPDGRPLGNRAAVKEAIEAAFPGVTYSPGSGTEVDGKALSSLHIPDDVMVALVNAPAPQEGTFRGERFVPQARGFGEQIKREEDTNRMPGSPFRSTLKHPATI